MYMRSKLKPCAATYTIRALQCKSALRCDHAENFFRKWLTMDSYGPTMDKMMIVMGGGADRKTPVADGRSAPRGTRLKECRMVTGRNSRGVAGNHKSTARTK